MSAVKMDVDGVYFASDIIQGRLAYFAERLRVCSDELMAAGNAGLTKDCILACTRLAAIGKVFTNEFAEVGSSLPCAPSVYDEVIDVMNDELSLANANVDSHADKANEIRAELGLQPREPEVELTGKGSTVKGITN